MSAESKTNQPSSPASGEPFASLEALRRAHSALIRRQHGGAVEKRPAVEDLVSFLRRARATGRRVADPDGRDAIQGMLDYWASAILGQRPELASSVALLEPEAWDRGETGPSDAAEGAREGETAARVQALLAGAAVDFERALGTEDRKRLRTVLSRLVRLGAGAGEFRLESLPAQDPVLADGAEADRRRALVGEMAKAGLLRTETGLDIEAWVLAHPVLLETWPTLKRLGDDRRAFRELALGWDRGGRHTAALLNRGQQLAQASEFVDLNPVEAAFLRESRSRTERQWKMLAVAATLLLVVQLGIFSVALRKERAARETEQGLNQSLAQQRAQLVEANAQLEEERRKLIRTNAALVFERNRAETSEQEARRKAEDLQQALTKLQTTLKGAEQLSRTLDRMLVSPQVRTNLGQFKIDPKAILDVGGELRSTRELLRKEYTPRYKIDF